MSATTMTSATAIASPTSHKIVSELETSLTYMARFVAIIANRDISYVP
jgi:hypothetical protein